MEQGVVIKSTGNRVTVRLENGFRMDCRLKGQFRIRNIRHTNPVAIGDRVIVGSREADGTGIITGIEQRDNYIVRRATKLSKASHIIAANLDSALLVATLAWPRTSVGFIDRFLVTAAAYYIPAGIIFHKTDLYNEDELKWLRELILVYSRAGYPCFTSSIVSGEGIEEIRRNLKDRVTLLSGHSGAGKSALIHSIDPLLNPRIGELSQAHGKGMHTTTFAEMYELEQGGFIVDTPGIREFGLFDFDPADVPRCFPEMDKLLPMCQFSNCTHVHEPGCAVKSAIETGEVSQLRYNSYLSILNDH